jgi:hypothetical protein
VAITVAAVPLWLHMWLVDECRRYLEKAKSSAPARSNRQIELRLLAALALAQMGREGPTPEATSALEGALDIAERLDDAEYLVQVISGQWVYHAMRGNCRAAMPLALKLGRVSAVAPLGDWLTGITLHYQGDQAAARRLLESSCDANPSVDAVLARVLWLQGFPGQATALVAGSLERAGAAERVAWLCNVLGEAACPIALATGDLTAFERYVRELLDLSERHSFDCWRLPTRCCECAARTLPTGWRLSAPASTNTARARSGKASSLSSWREGSV